MKRDMKTIRRGTLMAVGMVFLVVACALAVDAVAAPGGGGTLAGGAGTLGGGGGAAPSGGTEVASTHEVAFMLLAGLGLLVLSLLITRLLWAVRIAKSFAWFLPVFVVLSGGLWVWLTLAKYPGLQSLHTLVQFLLMASAFVWLVYLAARVAIPEEAQRTRGSLPPLIRYLIVLVIGVLGLFVLLAWSFPDLSFTPVFLTSGVLSIIVGLAVQNLLSNLLAGVVLGVQRPFKVGEWIQIGDVKGEVVEINWRATVVRTRQNDRVEFPNGLIAKECVVNFDRAALHQIKIQVGVSYETPPGLIASALFDAGSRVPGVLPSPSMEANLKDFGDSALGYELTAFVDNYACNDAVESELRKEIWYAFRRYNITIAFPQRDVNLRQVVEPPARRHGRLIAAAGLPHGARFELVEERVTIGREGHCRICLNDPHVSNEHAVIERTDAGFVLRDLQSRHGTLVNGAPVTSAPLQQGDEIRIGPFGLIFESNVAPASMQYVPPLGGSQPLGACPPASGNAPIVVAPPAADAAPQS